MSVRALSRVWEHSQHGGTELLMLLAIADFADDNGTAYPSVATLAAKCRMKPRNANYILAALEASGELDIQRNKGPAGANRYRVTLPLQRVAPLQGSAPLQCSAPTPAMECATPLQRSADKPSLNRQEPSLRASARSPEASTASRKAKTARKAEHPLFAEFYEAYPRKVARPDAAKAFDTLNPDRALLQAMLAAIKAQNLAARCASGESRYVPHPATWLNKERWKDAVEPARGARASGSALLHADDNLGGGACP